MAFTARRALWMIPRAASACALLFAATANATVVSTGGTWLTSYDVTLEAGYSDVTNILMLEPGPDGGSTPCAFIALSDPNRELPNTTTLTNAFHLGFQPTQSLLIGLTTGLPSDDEQLPQDHVVLMMDDTEASLANHIACGTLFRNYTEEQIIAAIKLGTSGQAFPVVLLGINDWASSDGTYGVLTTDIDNSVMGPDGPARPVFFQTGRRSRSWRSR